MLNKTTLASFSHPRKGILGILFTKHLSSTRCVPLTGLVEDQAQFAEEKRETARGVMLCH